MSRIVLDAVGGDHAPTEAIAGVALALKSGFLKPDEVVLTGPEQQVRDACLVAGVSAEVEIVDAPDLLSCGDSPTDAMRKKPRNSIAVGIQLVKEGKATGFVSAGSTGTVVAAATLGLRYLEGIRRAAIACIIEGEKQPFLVLDVGANPMPKAHHMAHYALMGSAYYECQFKTEKPAVGLLNIGSEELKGNPIVRDAHALMQGLPINFRGNVEGDEVFAGGCHVVVTDGFSGNVLLKVSEGVAEYLLRTTLGAMMKVGVSKEHVQAVQKAVMARIDFSEYGGALLLGVEGYVTICHGRSRAPAFANALRFAHRAHAGKVNEHIVQAAKAFNLAGGNGAGGNGAGGNDGDGSAAPSKGVTNEENT
ncbi:MAG: glycerol-3-phosphate acyltransferase PlsX [Planctomycetota bacterium]|jgi:glycerol-3-phosphate acyltransferase PlsX